MDFELECAHRYTKSKFLRADSKKKTKNKKGIRNTFPYFKSKLWTTKSKFDRIEPNLDLIFGVVPFC